MPSWTCPTRFVTLDNSMSAKGIVGDLAASQFSAEPRRNSELRSENEEVVQARTQNVHNFADTPNSIPLKPLFCSISMAPELPLGFRYSDAIAVTIKFSGDPSAAGLTEHSVAARWRQHEHEVSVDPDMRMDMPTNTARFCALPAISRHQSQCGFTLPRHYPGPTVLELTFPPAETVVPTFSGLPSHSRSRDPLVIWSHVAGNYQQAARDVLGKMK